jgi:hypothetical protein
VSVELAVTEGAAASDATAGTPIPVRTLYDAARRARIPPRLPRRIRPPRPTRRRTPARRPTPPRIRTRGSRAS